MSARIRSSSGKTGLTLVGRLCILFAVGLLLWGAAISPLGCAEENPYFDEPGLPCGGVDDVCPEGYSCSCTSTEDDGTLISVCCPTSSFQ